MAKKQKYSSEKNIKCDIVSQRFVAGVTRKIKKAGTRFLCTGLQKSNRRSVISGSDNTGPHPPV